VPRPPIGRGASGASRPAIVVLGDLALDVVVASPRARLTGSDVPGSVALRQGGSAATTARVLAALGADATLVAAVGTDRVGRALVRDLRNAGVRVRAVRIAGGRTARIAVILAAGERSFVADRGAADALAPALVPTAWFAGIDALHVPAYSLLSEPLAGAARRAIDLARSRRAAVSIDLASSGPLLALGRRAAMDLVVGLSPDLLFGTAAEAEALLGPGEPAGLTNAAPVVVVKRGGAGVSVLARRDDDDSVVAFDVATRPLPPGDPTGAGDALDAGFLAVWAAAPRAERSSVGVLRRAALAGNQAARRYLSTPRRELDLG
jgi:ribokinase